jgi:hypothetical protein
VELKDWLGPTISGIGALITVVFSVITRFEVRRQQRLQAFGLRRQYDADLRTWANGALVAFTDAVTLTYTPPTSLDAKQFLLRREETLSRLSAIAEQGRLFFPNEQPDAHGAWKSSAYRGFRPAVLECVIGAFNELKQVTPEGPNDKRSAAIVQHRRDFVGHIQERLDPRARDAELKELLT